MRDWTALEEPLPTAISTITEATPIVMPRIVRPGAELVRGDPAPRDAQRLEADHGCASDDAGADAGGGRTSGLRRRGRRVVHAERAAVLDDLAVAQPDHPLGLLGDVGLVRDQHDGAAFFVQAREDPQDVLGGVRVEVAGRLVGEDQRGVGHDRPRDRDPLLLAAGQLGGLVVQAVGHPHRARARASARRRRSAPLSPA